jgi:nicotinamidase-related amidase
MKDFNMENTIVFSVDMNNGFAKKGPLYSSRIEGLIPKTVAFFQKAIQKGIPIIGFTDAHDPEAIEFGNYPVHCLDGTEESEVVDELKGFMVEIIKKNSTNCFFASDFNWESDHNYIITGCCTDICIYQFAVTLKAYFNQHGIWSRVIVPSSLVDTYDAPGHDAEALNAVFLASMASNGVEVPESL